MDQKVTLTFTVTEINLILAGLGKLPLEAGIELFSRIKTEGESQITPIQAEPPVSE